MLKKFNTDYGLLIIRIGLGISFLFHGYPKISGGPQKWEKIGGAMVNLGIDFAPTLWGFLAGLTEFGGAFCLILGLFFRPVVASFIFTMFVAVLMHYTKGDGFSGFSHPLEIGIVFLGLFFAGPGKYAFKIVKR